MQTFLPYESFSESAKCLDWRRLGKQRVEAMQILNTISGVSRGWVNHPAVKMWRGYEEALQMYFNAISMEWVKRGYQHNMGFYSNIYCVKPHWLGNTEFHLSHQSNLLRKMPQHYGPLFPDVPDNLEYVWPPSLTQPQDAWTL